MKREIKFRAWITGEGMIEMTGALSSLSRFFKLMELDDRPKRIMQFTGLTDVNGFEIFEGDIVKSECGSCSGDVNYEWKEFVSWNEEELDDALHYTDCEVIGNIYENPDLI